MKTLKEAAEVTGLPTHFWYYAANKGYIPVDNTQPVMRVTDEVMKKFAQKHKERLQRGHRQGSPWEVVTEKIELAPTPLDDAITQLEGKLSEIEKSRARVQDQIDTLTLQLYELEDMAKVTGEQLATIRKAQAIAQELANSHRHRRLDGEGPGVETLPTG